MKRILAIIIVFMLCCSCNIKNTSEKQYRKMSTGVWISFSEINSMLDSQNGFEYELENIVENCMKANIENVYIHIRSHGDSLFKSEYFPIKENAQKYNFDIFGAMIDAFHKENIKVHAWINPYRISASTTDIQTLHSENPAYIWIKDEDQNNDRNVCLYNGIYLNPAESDVRRLVIDGIREVLSKYEVDGIHFDDYFYPTTDEEFDKISYLDYCQNTQNPLALEEWRRENVNSLINGCFTAIKYIDKDVIFSISPTASIDNNYSQLYADVKAWVKDGYVDCIIPQLYFGFEYPDKDYCFESLINDWEKLISCNKQVQLFIGLANYKIGTDALPDSEEWNKSDDIIARQAQICAKSGNIDGYVLFSYSSVFSSNSLNSAQLDNLLAVSEKFIN